jgi:glycosyltransferase involved in cell wall biosynthesis
MKLTLIQIHYHLRAGGVTTVIQRYSEAFAKLTNCDSQSIVMCNENISDADNYTKIVRVNECEYKNYTDETEFINDREKIEFSLDKCIYEQHKQGRVVVIAHNLALGKNLALTSAFYNSAIRYSQDTITFFSVLHDFAEEGRINEIDAIRNVERFQNDIKKQMYCIGAPVKIVVPSKSTMYMMRKFGFDVATVSNPVNCDKHVVNKNTIENIRYSLFSNTHKQLLPFDKNKRIAYYPVRIIPRKNIYEAILISCIFFDSSLITGPSGNSVQDIIRYRNLDDFVRRNKLPVITDVIAKCDLQNKYHEKLVETIMLASDYVVSTSVSEGFGYTLFEPWIQQKMLIARKITGFSMPDGWNDDSMYSFLPVPVKWIDINRINKEYDVYFFECFGKEKKWPFEKYFVHDMFVDFAALSEYDQMSIIEMILDDSSKRNEWFKILEESVNGWSGLQQIYNRAMQSISYHSNIIQGEFGDNVFRKTFSDVFLQSGSNFIQQADYQKIETHFQSPDYFRLLLGNQYCRICDK